MRILLDECMPMAVLDYLMGKKFDVVHVKHTEWEGFSNSDLYEKAQGEFQIFITTDRHFAHPEKFKPRSTFGVIYLRVAPTVSSFLIRALDQFLLKTGFENVIGKLTIVRRNDFSIR